MYESTKVYDDFDETPYVEEDEEQWERVLQNQDQSISFNETETCLSLSITCTLKNDPLQLCETYLIDKNILSCDNEIHQVNLHYSISHKFEEEHYLEPIQVTSNKEHLENWVKNI